ncbi:MAG: hypothetical protein ACREQ9_09540 [Candidatus Binatia bacterium]
MRIGPQILQNRSLIGKQSTKALAPGYLPPVADPRAEQAAVLTLQLSDASSRTLDRECRVLTRHLVSQEPNEYVLGKYREAHRVNDAFQSRDVDAFDRLLLRLVRAHPLAAKLADTYTALFHRTSLVRRKAVLLIAILESCAPTHLCFDVPDTQHKTLLSLHGLVRVSGFALALVLSTALLSPLRLVLGFRARRAD